MSQFNPAGGEQDGFGPSTRRSQLPLWSRLIDLFWFYGSLKLMIMQILQHNYNVLARDLVEMDSASADAMQTGGGSRQEKLAELTVAIGRIEMIGNPIYELGRVVEILLVGALIIAYLAKKQLPLYNRLRGPVRIGVVQMLLDPSRELKYTTGCQIGSLANNYYESLGNFWRTKQEELSALDQELRRPGSGGLDGVSGAHEIPRAQKRALNVMRDLVAGKAAHDNNGQLVPPNRTAAWARQSAKLCCALLLGASLLATLLLIILLVVIPISGVIDMKYRASPGALLSHVELYIFAILAANWIVFPYVLMLIIVGDQMKFERELRRMIEQLLEDLNGQKQTIELATKCELSPMRRELEQRLLRVLTLYKLFKRQLRAAQPLVGFIGAHMAFLILFLPIMGRLYAAHMTREERLILMAAALVMIAACNFIVLPNCVIQARCLRLFNRMTQLLVHIDGLIAREAACENGLRAQQVCDVHMVWMLRKEVRAPEMAVRSFTTRALFLRLTYARWLGIHFWCGLLLAPLLMRDTARLGSVGVPLVESLGLF